ncbi:hypothetical protein KSP40_PGU009300 [Platanthera guangdongensis]|uniref:Uncharacterized protein n=1 Tax=Platanthera guangdongensis TaxID=2320717 RepID=A0ABR2LVX7_9ASPA
MGKEKKVAYVMRPAFSLNTSHQGSHEIKKLDVKEGIRLLSFLERTRSQDGAVAGEGTFKSHVVDNVSLEDISKVDQPEYILIPSLPNGSNGNHGSQITAAVIGNGSQNCLFTMTRLEQKMLVL